MQISLKPNYTHARLSGVDFSNRNFLGVLFIGASCIGTNFENSDLEGSIFREANLVDANFRNANLKQTELANADLTGADFKGTVLDPNAPLPELTDEEIIEAGLQLDELEGRKILRGYRTYRSIYTGNNEYTIGEHKAPYFSVCKETVCHPGIYFAPWSYFEHRYWSCGIVPCYAFRDETVHAGDMFRAKRIFVTGGVSV